MATILMPWRGRSSNLHASVQAMQDYFRDGRTWNGVAVPYQILHFPLHTAPQRSTWSRGLGSLGSRDDSFPGCPIVPSGVADRAA